MPRMFQCVMTHMGCIAWFQMVQTFVNGVYEKLSYSYHNDWHEEGSAYIANLLIGMFLSFGTFSNEYFKVYIGYVQIYL